MWGEGEVVTKLTNAVNKQNIHKFSHKKKLKIWHTKIQSFFIFGVVGEYNIKERN